VLAEGGRLSAEGGGRRAAGRDCEKEANIKTKTNEEGRT